MGPLLPLHRREGPHRVLRARNDIRVDAVPQCTAGDAVRRGPGLSEGWIANGCIELRAPPRIRLRAWPSYRLEGRRRYLLLTHRKPRLEWHGGYRPIQS